MNIVKLEMRIKCDALFPIFNDNEIQFIHIGGVDGVAVWLFSEEK